jgi:DNA polymerase III delta prime subunit
MALRGKKPEKIEKRLKALFYGAAGVGKTTAGIQFPKPYLIDTERGAENDQYVKLLEQAGGAIFQTTDFEELVSEVKTLLTEKHDYKTLVIDPLTTVYNDLLEKSAAFLKAQSKEKDATGTEFGRHYGEANKKMKHLLNLLLRLDMNVIITSHAKNEYGQNLAVLGSTFDCYKKLDYLFDLVFEIQKRGTQRIGLVKKTRVEAFAETEQFPFSYDTIAEKYGRDVLERDAVAQILASQEQVNEINRLVELLKVPEETKEKWLDKSNAETFEEMKADDIQKYIDFLNSKIKGENN